MGFAILSARVRWVEFGSGSSEDRPLPLTGTNDPFTGRLGLGRDMDLGYESKGIGGIWYSNLPTFQCSRVRVFEYFVDQVFEYLNI